MREETELPMEERREEIWLLTLEDCRELLLMEDKNERTDERLLPDDKEETEPIEDEVLTLDEELLE